MAAPMDGGPPRDPRLDRFRPLAGALRRAIGVVVLLALGALVLPDPLRRWSGAAVIALLVGVPVLRVAWFARRWWRRGDRRYALVAGGVLCVVATGAVLGSL